VGDDLFNFIKRVRMEGDSLGALVNLKKNIKNHYFSNKDLFFFANNNLNKFTKLKKKYQPTGHSKRAHPLGEVQRVGDGNDGAARVLVGRPVEQCVEHL
jgi:hypothetical protein